MKVLHAPKNVAGQATMISRAQRRRGVRSDVLVFDQNKYNFEYDFVYDLARYPGWLRPAVKGIRFPRFFFNYDVFHFHYGTTLLPANLDLPLFATLGKALGKKTIMHYWGSDIIQRDVARKYTLFTDEIFRSVYPSVDDDARRRQIRKMNELVDISIVGDYSLLPFSPDSHVIRQALDHTKIPYVGCPPKDGDINIVHAPTNREIKGTGYIIEAVENLKKEGHRVRLTIVENTPHDKAIEIFKEADIVVDDVLQGPYGIFSMECMALGKPVLCRIDEKLVNYYQDLPIVNTPRDRIDENLRTLIRDPGLREQLGKKGRDYVITNHDADVIAGQILAIYEEIEA
jgi:glycosyltransferase involved in cell wall biosynthesis